MGTYIFVLPENLNIIDAEFINHFYKLLPVILSLCGATSSFLLYTFDCIIGAVILIVLFFTSLSSKLIFPPQLTIIYSYITSIFVLPPILMKWGQWRKEKKGFIISPGRSMDD